MHPRRNPLVHLQRLRSVPCPVVRHEQPAPRRSRRRLRLYVTIEHLDRSLGLLRLQQRAAQPFQGLRAIGTQSQRSLKLLFRSGQIILVQRRRRIGYSAEEARRPERCIYPGIACAVLFGLFQKADRSPEVQLLHPHIAEASQGAGVLRIIRKDGLEPRLGVIESLCIQCVIRLLHLHAAGPFLGRRSRLFGRLCRRGRPRSHLGLVLQGGCKLRIVMLQKIGTDIGCARRIRRVPQQRLPQRRSGLRIVRMLLQQPATLFTGLWVVSQNAAQGNLVPGIRRKLLHHSGRFGLVIGQRPVACRRGATKDLPVDHHRLSILPGLGQLPCLLQLRSLILLRSHVLHPRNIRIRRIDRPQTIQIGCREGCIPAQLGRSGQTSQRRCILRVGQQHLLPCLRRHIHTAADFQCMCLVQQRLRRCLRSLPSLRSQ